MEKETFAEMKKIGIITIHNSPNYGACLQSYALWKYIHEQGCDVEIIDLLRPTHDGYKASRNFKECRPPKRNILTKIKSFLRILFIKANTVYPLSEVAKMKFDKFNSGICLSRTYANIDDLYKNPPEYDLYITGSDQVWNPSQAYCIEPYFLTFAPKAKMKISYASSIGITELTEKEVRMFKDRLSFYTAVSVREKSAKVLLEKITGLPIEQVADPTFLLSHNTWQNLSESSEYAFTDYIFLFTLSYNVDLFEYVSNLSKQSGKQFIFLCGNIHSVPKQVEYQCTFISDAGPCDFLRLIEKATLVITDSFHCTVFSIILQANNFYTFIPKGNNRGSRIIDLLSRFSLRMHLLEVPLKLSYKSLMGNVINHKNINAVYQEVQSESQAFLNKYL